MTYDGTPVMTYDDATGRMLSKSYAGTASGSGDIAYGYGTDNKDALLRNITRPGSVETLDYYQNSSNATGDVQWIRFNTSQQTYNFNYDIFGRTSSVIQTDGGTAQTVGYNYNADGRLWSASQPWAAREPSQSPTATLLNCARIFVPLAVGIQKLGL